MNLAGAFRYLSGICLMLSVWIGCSPVPEPLPPSQIDSKIPDQEAWGWATTLTLGGRKRAEVEAAHFQKYDRSGIAQLDGGVTVWFYNSSGTTQVSKLSGHRAEIEEKTGNMVVIGEVVLVAEDSTRLETDTLRWHRENEKITGNGKVTIRRPDGEETGVGFEASSDLRRWSMHQVLTRLGRSDSLR